MHVSFRFAFNVRHFFLLLLFLLCIVLSCNVFLTHTFVSLAYAMVNVCKQPTGRYSACVIFVKLFISLIMSLFLSVCVLLSRLHVYVFCGVCMHTYAWQIHIRKLSRAISLRFVIQLYAFLAACMCLFEILVFVRERALSMHDIHMQCIFVELAKPAFDHVLEVKCAANVDAELINDDGTDPAWVSVLCMYCVTIS